MSGAEGLRIGLIGCGRLAEAGYLPAIAATPRLRLVAAADPSSDRRRRIAELAGELPTFESVDELLARSSLDAVVVASPVDTHLPAAESSAAAGIPALVEKPPAPDLDGARRLAALDPPPWIGFNRRFSLGAGLERMRRGPEAQLQVEGEIAYRRRSWGPLGALGDAWIDLGPHLVDLALLAAGGELEPATALLRERDARVELAGDGIRVRLHCRTDGAHRERLRVTDARGTVLFEREDGGLRLRSRLLRRRHPLVASLAAQLDALADALREPGAASGRLATAAEGTAVMAIVDGARVVAGAEIGAEGAAAG